MPPCGWLTFRKEVKTIKDNKPIIEVSPKRLMCPGHGEHLAENWPTGFAMASMTILRAVLDDERLHAAIRTIGGKNKDGKLNINYINLITEKRPFCYFVDRDVIRQALTSSGIGTIAICHICGRSGMGGPYRVAAAMGKGSAKLPHVCFECALDTGERMHRAHPNGGVWHD